MSNETLKVCETCPWLTKNHGKEHPAGWYTTNNLRRMWNGLRSGKCPGVVCHASDPDQKDYGGIAPIKLTVERRQCAGAILAVGKHVDKLNAAAKTGGLALQAYKDGHAAPLTRRGMVYWIERVMSGTVPAVEDRRDEVSLPWENQPKINDKD